MFLLKISILLLDDNRLLSQYFLIKNIFFIYGRVYICNFKGILQVNIIIFS